MAVVDINKAIVLIPAFEEPSYPADLAFDHEGSTNCAQVIANASGNLAYSKVGVEPADMDQYFDVNQRTGRHFTLENHAIR